MKSNSKLNNKSKASSPFTGKPTIGINLANAVGGLYNLEAELKELEKPSLKPPKDNNNNKKKVLIKANNAPRKPEIKVISNKNNEKSNSQNIAQIEEFKNEPTIENINEKNTKKRLIFQLDYLKNTNISILNTLIEAFKNSPEFFEKIKLSPKDLSTLPPLSLYYYIKLLQSGIIPLFLITFINIS